MKTMKKIAGLVLAICLVIPCFSMLTFAADGEIMFTDPSTKVGESLQLKGVLKADAAIEDRTIVMKYDTTMLKFKSGDSVKETSAGQLTYEVKGQQSGERVEFLMNFDVLKEGTTKVEVVSYQAWTTGNAQITCQRGNSTITIEAGTATTSPTEEPVDTPNGSTPAVSINNVSYTISNTFDKVEIPQGYEEGTLEYDGTQQKVLVNADSGVQLACLVDAEGNAELYMYVAEDATFVPFRSIDISDSTTITILSVRDEVSLSKTYVETVALIDGAEFPAWQNPEQTEICILYAINNKGEKSLYQFDTVEGTYQRFAESKVVEQEPTDSKDGIMGVIQENLEIVLICAGAALAILLIILIVVSVKLYNRNAELDDLYDEYGIDLDDEQKDDDEIFIRIDDETEEDVVLEEAPEETEDVEIPEIIIPVEDAMLAEEEDADILDKLDELPKREVEEQVFSIKEDLSAIAKDVSEEKNPLSEEDDEDFEIDFIDLDD